MFCIGLTGGIASGKTTISNAFANLGIQIIDTDVIAREVVQPGSFCLAEIDKRFGSSILESNGSLARKKLREIIFNRPEEKVWLEQLMHPVIAQQTREQIASAPLPYCILSSPLLIESPDIEIVNRVLVVDVPEALQISRTLARDKVSETQVKNTINTQFNRNERLTRADDIIDNSGSKEHALEQVMSLHRTYLELAKNYTS